MTAEKSKQIALVILLFLIIGVIYFQLSETYSFVQDDAYISFRYAENFINGNGLVFNENEYVEGYTNFLWVIILAVFKITGINYAASSQFLSVTFGFCVSIVTYLIAKKLIPSSQNKYIDQLNSMLPVYLLVLSGGFIYWASSGMETSLFILLVLLSINSAIRNNDPHKINFPSIIFLILAFLTRPDGYYFALMFIAFEYVIAKKKSAIIIKEILLIAIPALAHTIFRIAYYGYPLPNTFYAKSGLSDFFLRRGWEYFVNFAEAYLLFGLILIIPFAALINNGLRNRIGFLSILVLLFIFSITLIGGDVLPLHRLYLPVLPLIYILFVASIIYHIHSKKLITPILIVFIVTLGYFNLSNERTTLDDIHATEIGLVQKMTVYGDWVKERQIDEHRPMKVALSTIGAFSFYSNAKIIDLLGLTNEYIAHNPQEMKGISEPATRKWIERTYNTNYVLDQKPDYIIFPAGAKPSAFPEAALFVTPEFKKLYYPQLIYADNQRELLTIFTLRESLENPFIPTIERECRHNSVIDYITATNLFLKFSKTRDRSLLPKIIESADNALNKCLLNKDRVLTLKGMAYYFANEFEKSKQPFNEAIKSDSLNSHAHFHLVNIYHKENDKTNASKHVKFLKTISPHLYPQLTLD